MGGVPVTVGAGLPDGAVAEGLSHVPYQGWGAPAEGSTGAQQEVGAHNPDTAACSHLPDSSLWAWLLCSWPPRWQQKGCRLSWGLLASAQYRVRHPFLPGVLLAYRWFLSLLCLLSTCCGSHLLRVDTEVLSGASGPAQPAPGASRAFSSSPFSCPSGCCNKNT